MALWGKKRSTHLQQRQKKARCLSLKQFLKGLLSFSALHPKNEQRLPKAILKEA